MATPAAWTWSIPSQDKPAGWPIALRPWFWRLAAAVVFTLGAWCITTAAVRQGWLHILIEVSVALLAMAAGALAAIATLDRNHRQFVETMAQAMDARDPYTAGHSCRVGDYSYAMARAMGFSKRAARTMREAAELHDIGKIGVPDAVLQKRGPLTLEEIGLVRLHPVIGRKILEHTGNFKKLLPIVELHHENWDGSGYPHGLRGEGIPLESRIARVADAFDAMTSGRCYRAAPKLEWALEEMQRCSGTHFDPEVVRVFLALYEHGVFDRTLAAAAGEPWTTGASWDTAYAEDAAALALELASGSMRKVQQGA